MDLSHLTLKQLEFLRFIKSYKEDWGVFPTYRQIQERFNFASPNSVTQNIQSLINKGFLFKTDEGYILVEKESFVDADPYKVGFYDAKMEISLTKREASKIIGVSHSNFSSDKWAFPTSFSVHRLKSFLEAHSKHKYLNRLYLHFNLGWLIK